MITAEECFAERTGLVLAGTLADSDTDYIPVMLINPNRYPVTHTASSKVAYGQAAATIELNVDQKATKRRSVCMRVDGLNGTSSDDTPSILHETLEPLVQKELKKPEQQALRALLSKGKQLSSSQDNQ